MRQSISECGHQSPYIPFASEFGDKATTWLERTRNSGDDFVRLWNPMQGCVGKNGVEFLREGQRARIADAKLESGKFSARLADHFRRAIHADDGCAGGGNF